MSNHHSGLIGNVFVSIICSIASLIFLGLTSYMLVTLFDNIEIFGTLVGFVIFMGTFISLMFTMILFVLAIFFGINASDYDDWPKEHILIKLHYFN